jgi:predicted permease
MSNLLLALLCLAIGKLLQNVRQFPDSSAQTLNLYVIYVALPALILVQIPKIPLDPHVLAPVIFAWLMMGLSLGIVWLIARFFRWSATVTGGLLLVTVLGNTGFIGYPLIEAHLGKDALPYAILYDQLGTFLALNTLGIAIASRYAPEANIATEPLWRKILRFPPFSAIVLGFLLNFFDVPIAKFVDDVLHRIADTLVPVVMVAVGLQWRLRIEKTEYKPIVFAIIFILLIKPFIALILLLPIKLDPLIAHAILLEAAMPAMISTSALALMYQLAPRLVSTIIGYSLILSFATVWGWKVLITT